MKSSIKKAEAELQRILSLKQDLERYEDCSWKNALLKSCDLCEEVWKREIDNLKKISGAKTKKVTTRKKKDELSRTDLEKIAFDVDTPDDLAELALSDLMNIKAA